MSELRTDFDRDDGEKPRGSDEEIIKEAKDRWQRCKTYYGPANTRFEEDTKFGNADAENGFQWPDKWRKRRINDDRPVLTINQARQHNLQIINDGRQNKPSVKVRPVGGPASMKSAEVIEGIVRHIEYISNATVAYDWARTHQVVGGRGYLRVKTGYADNDTFDQEIYICRVIDPLTVFTDPDAREFDASDMRFAFLFKRVAKEEFDQQYPEYKGIPQNTALGDGVWVDDDHVVVAEYYRRSEKKDRLMHFTDPQSRQQYNMRESEVRELGLPDEIWQAVLADPDTKIRDITDDQVDHFVLVGDHVAERGRWAGRTIPIIPVLGEVTFIDGVWDCKGHTRAAIDAQRMLNYWFSSATEHLGLQSKTPYIAGKRAIEGVETYWSTANTENHSYLPYNDIDDEGNALPPPQRQEPPMMAPAFVEGMQVAVQQLQAVTGQYAPQMGEPSNEKSGRAIAERQRQGDNATYHFVDNEAVAIRRVGKIILELLPYIYDERQVIKILAQDGEQSEIRLDHNQSQAVREEKIGENEVLRIFNPNVGKYEVHADIGPAYSTQRQEAWNAFVQIAASAPQFMQIAADLMFQAADFPMADKIAERFKRTIPPGILGDGLPPAVEQQLQQMQMQLQKANETAQKAAAAAQQATTRLADAQKRSMVGDLKLAAKGVQDAGDGQKLRIEAYKAETERLNTFLDAMTNAGNDAAEEGEGGKEGGGSAEPEIAALDHKQIAALAALLVLDAMRTPLTGNGAA